MKVPLTMQDEQALRAEREFERTIRVLHARSTYAPQDSADPSTLPATAAEIWTAQSTAASKLRERVLTGVACVLVGTTLAVIIVAFLLGPLY